MTYETDGNACLSIEIDLKRENHEHFAENFRQGARPLRTAGPDLRADVVHHGNAVAFRQARDVNVESVGGDRDDDVWRVRAKNGPHRAPGAPQMRQLQD